MLEPVLEWENLRPGHAFPVARCTLDDAFVDAYLQATGEDHPLYRAGHAPALCLSLVRFTKASLGGRWPSGTLQLGQRFRSLRALRRGERIAMDLRIGKLEERNGRRYFELLSTGRDEAGAPVAEQQMDLMWAGTTKAGPSKPSDKKEIKEKPTLGPLTDRFPMARLRAYGEVAGARDPIHLDPEFAKSTPIGANVAQGKLVMTLISRLMLEHLGERWLERGNLDIRFRRPVLVDEPIQAWAAAPGAEGFEFAVWCENPRGERVIEGNAGT
jgi:3-hydroxybutyryl-CoA dehydratase